MSGREEYVEGVANWLVGRGWCFYNITVGGFTMKLWFWNVDSVGLRDETDNFGMYCSFSEDLELKKLVIFRFEALNSFEADDGGFKRQIYRVTCAAPKRASCCWLLTLVAVADCGTWAWFQNAAAVCGAETDCC